jgi:hypothetical protein
MEPGSLDKLQYDKRLRLRKGWVSTDETESHLESLPDVSDKIATSDEEPAESRQTAPSGENFAEAPAGTPEPAVESPPDPLSPPPFREV